MCSFRSDFETRFFLGLLEFARQPLPEFYESLPLKSDWHLDNSAWTLLSSDLYTAAGGTFDPQRMDSEMSLTFSHCGVNRTVHPYRLVPA
jgi:hypothetical protein